MVVRCQRCDMGMVDRAVVDTDHLYLVDDYFGGTAGTTAGYDDYRYTEEHSLAWASRLLELVARPGPVLDIGCADGNLLQRIRRSRGRYGIEVNPAMVARAVDAGVEIVGHDILDPSIAQQFQGFFAGITGIAVLEHVHDFRAAVEAAVGCLRSDGVFLFEVPLISSEGSDNAWFSTSLEHVFYPSAAALEYLFGGLLGLRLVGKEVAIRGYASTYVGVVAIDHDRAMDLAESFERLTNGPVEGLRTHDERAFRVLFDVVHAARSSPGVVRLLDQEMLDELNGPLLRRLGEVWAADAEAAAYLPVVEQARDWHAAQADKWRAASQWHAEQAAHWQAESTSAHTSRALPDRLMRIVRSAASRFRAFGGLFAGR
jgi:SAM-dependent methyltransferase